MLFPREEEDNENVKENPQLTNLTNLSCRKKTTDNYNVTVNNIYQNNDISKVTISYSQVVNNENITQQSDTTNNDVTNNATTDTQIQTTDTTTQTQQTDQTQTQPAITDNVLSEMETLRGIEAITKSETETNHQFIILMKNLEKIPIPNEITFRLQSLTAQKKFYENLGYTCTKVNV